MENEKIISMNEDNIKFKARQFFGQPRLWDVLTTMKIAKTESVKLLITLKRISEKIKSEAEIIESALKTTQEPYIVTNEDGQQSLPAHGTPEFIELDGKITELLEAEIMIPIPKIKLSQVTGIKSLAELEAVSGIIDIDDIDA
jgi:hypothetical protein